VAQPVRLVLPVQTEVMVPLQQFLLGRLRLELQGLAQQLQTADHLLLLFLTFQFRRALRVQQVLMARMALMVQTVKAFQRVGQQAKYSRKQAQQIMQQNGRMKLQLGKTPPKPGLILKGQAQ
tara:strand:- start:1591 stop:1956 length:366 start_codon:yes stop_codon:yes gene_type:complete